MFSLRRFLKDATIYSLAGWLSRAMSIILLPLYTRIFSPADYGVLDLLAASTAFLTIALQLGLNSSITRFFHDDTTQADQKAYFATGFWLKVIVYVPIVIGLIFFAEDLSRFLYGHNDFEALITWALISVFTSGLWTYLLLIYRLRFKSLAYSTFSMLRLLAGVGLTIYFVVVIRTGIIGIYWANVIVDATLAITLLLLNGGYIFRPDFSRAKSLLKFGLPLIPSALAYFSMLYLDRYFIQIYWGETQLGLYAVVYKFSGILAMITAGFSVAWAPFLWSVYGQAEGPTIIRTIFKGFALCLSLLALAMGLFSREILTILTTPDYISGASIAYLIVLAVVIYYTTDYFCVGIDGTKKTTYRLWAGIMAAAANFGLNCFSFRHLASAGRPGPPCSLTPFTAFT